MKKILAMLLVMALCLSLCGCAFLVKAGSDDTTTEQKNEGGISFGNKTDDKYDALIEAIEANDFEKAYAELVKFAQEAEGISQPTQDEKYAELAKNAVGEWITFEEDATDVKTLIINEDGTGTYGDENFNWTVENGDEDYFQLKCLVDGIDFKYMVSLGKYDDAKVWECQVYVVEVHDEYSWSSIHEDEDTYFTRYNKDVLEIVDITPENFFDYFELRPEVEWRCNEFGEVEDWSRNSYLFLKSDYADRFVDTGSSIAIQYTAGYTFYECDFDLESKTLTIGDKLDIDRDPVDDTRTINMYRYNTEIFPDDYNVDSFWTSYGDYWYDGEKYCVVSDFEDFTIVRSAGQLVFVK